MTTENPQSKIENRKSKIIFIALAALTVIPYLPSLFAPFAALDDMHYVKKNPWIQAITIDNLRNIFTKPYLHNYLPFHLLNYAIDYNIWGDNPIWYRVENIVWHVGNVLMAFVIFKRLMKRTDVAALVSLFFGIHPVCVDSVAWIAERKNVLSQFFGLLSFWLYMTRDEERRRYIWSVIFCFVGLFCKTSIVILPLLLIIYQWLFEGTTKWKGLLADKIPYFALALAAGLATVYAQTPDPRYNEVRGGGPIVTAFTVAVVWMRYIFLTFLPLNLAEAYEVKKWGIAPISIIAATALVILISIAIGVRRTRPLVTFGALWFFIALLPVSNIFWLSVTLKNRYFYLPLIGACLVVGDLWRLLFDWREKFGRAVAVVILLCMAAFCFHQSYLWSSPMKTWFWAARVAPNCIESHIGLAAAYLLVSQPEKRNEHRGIAQAIVDGLPTDRITVARLFLDVGWTQDALKLAEKILPAAPDNPDLLVTAGMAALRVGKKAEAKQYLEKAVNSGSKDSLAYEGLGILVADSGADEEAVKLLKKAIEIDPNNKDAHLKLAILFEKTDPDMALFHFRRVLQIDPDHTSKVAIQKAINGILSKKQ